MSSTPRLLAVVLFYNAVADTVRTAQSLAAQEGVALDILIFDNASERAARAALDAALPDREVCTSAQNLGYTGGNNAALQLGVARGYDYVVLCNQDIVVPPTAVARLLESAVVHPKAGLIGGVEIGHASGELRAAGGQGFSRITGRFRWDTRVHRSETPGRAVEFVQGALVMVSSALVRLGLRFDDQLFLYYDEVDLGLQARALGFETIIDDRVHIRHNNTSNFLSPAAAYYHQRNRVYMVRKYGTPLTVAAHVMLMVAVELPIKTCVRGLQGHGRFVAACWHGFLDGLLHVMGAGPGTAAPWHPNRAR